MRFIFFTKTNWDETPRIRHQLAQLLVDHGHEVVFFQKPKYFLQKVKGEKLVAPVTLKRTNQLIHHQLRVFSFLATVNAFFEKISISRQLKKINCNKSDVIVNFNYDYYFLNSLLPNNKIIAVINDDFVAQSKLFNGRHAYKALIKTCQVSHETLVVSYPLQKQIANVCKPKLFLPWSDVNYQLKERSKPDSVLLWGYINHRIDFELIEYASVALPDISFHIYGPVDNKASISIKHISKLPNVYIHSQQKLDNIDLGDFFASIIPYRAGIRSVEAATMPNKTLQLLSRGLPIVASGMPNLYSHKAIVNAAEKEDFVEGIKKLKRKWPALQEDIQTLVSKNTGQQRYQEFIDLVKKQS